MAMPAPIYDKHTEEDVKEMDIEELGESQAVVTRHAAPRRVVPICSRSVWPSLPRQSDCLRSADEMKARGEAWARSHEVTMENDFRRRLEAENELKEFDKERAEARKPLAATLLSRQLKCKDNTKEKMDTDKLMMCADEQRTALTKGQELQSAYERLEVATAAASEEYTQKMNDFIEGQKLLQKGKFDEFEDMRAADAEKLENAKRQRDESAAANARVAAKKARVAAAPSAEEAAALDVADPDTSAPSADPATTTLVAPPVTSSTATYDCFTSRPVEPEKERVLLEHLQVPFQMMTEDDIKEIDKIAKNGEDIIVTTNVQHIMPKILLTGRPKTIPQLWCWPDVEVNVKDAADGAADGYKDEHGRVFENGDIDYRYKGWLMRLHHEIFKMGRFVQDETAHDAPRSSGGIVGKLLVNYKNDQHAPPEEQIGRLKVTPHEWEIDTSGLDRQSKYHILYDNKYYELAGDFPSQRKVYKKGGCGDGWLHFCLAEEQSASDIKWWRPCTLMEAFREYWRCHTSKLEHWGDKVPWAKRFYKLASNPTPRPGMKAPVLAPGR